MKVSNNMTTEQVKRAFNKKFPKLKIEFYVKKHEVYSNSSNMDLITEEVALSELNPSMNDGNLPLDENIKVSELESLMEEYFGLHIQVFRKSGEQWMQTSVTDNWTLGKQEKKGEEAESM